MKDKLQLFTVNWKKAVNTNNTDYYPNKWTFVIPFHRFSMAGNIIVYTPSQGTNREKYFIFLFTFIFVFTNKGKKATLAKIEHFFFHLFPHRPCPHHLSTDNVRTQSVRDRHQIAHTNSRAGTKTMKINTISEGTPYWENISKKIQN